MGEVCRGVGIEEGEGLKYAMIMKLVFKAVFANEDWVRTSY